MNENYTHINDAHLIEYLQKRTTDTENKQIENWMQVSEENRMQFENVKQLWKISSMTEDFEKIDTDASWKKVAHKIEDSTEPKVRKIGFSILWKVAASVILLIGISIPFFIDNDTSLIATTTKEYTLPDGTQLWLKKGSELTYTNDFNAEKRDVKLKGEAYFKVAKNKLKPFTITLNTTTTKVLGTEFNLKDDKSNGTSLTLIEGSVKFSNKKTFKIIKSGETVSAQEDGTLAVNSIKNVNVDSWKTKIFQFNKTDLSQVIKDVANAYDTQFIIKNEALLDCKLTATFNNQSLDMIVETLRVLYQFSVVKDGDTIRLINGRCVS
ncbi:FecR domain-containing protein [uncultured Algibacter sp.]|uniref:FecR family protein n=1 Tax=uncultured Algibacter sp. TaxID=298659 RepID=UPI00321724C4